MPLYRTLVSVNTGEMNRLVSAWPVVPLTMNEPPKYLNKSKFAVTIYLIQFAPDATKVKTIVTKYSIIETIVDSIPFLKMVEIVNAIITNIQTLINTQAKYIRYSSGAEMLNTYFALNTASIGNEFRS